MKTFKNTVSVFIVIVLTGCIAPVFSPVGQIEDLGNVYLLDGEDYAFSLIVIGQPLSVSCAINEETIELIDQGNNVWGETLYYATHMAAAPSEVLMTCTATYSFGNIQSNVGTIYQVENERPVLSLLVDVENSVSICNKVGEFIDTPIIDTNNSQYITGAKYGGMSGDIFTGHQPSPHQLMVNLFTGNIMGRTQTGYDHFETNFIIFATTKAGTVQKTFTLIIYEPPCMA